MAIVVIGMSGKPDTFRIERSRLVVDMMTGNLSYPTPTPALALVTTATDKYDDAYQDSILGGVTDTAMLKLRRDDQYVIVKQLAAYVQEASLGDEEIILSSGFGVKRKPGAPQLPDTPHNLRVKTTDNAGEYSLIFKSVKGSKMYRYEHTTTPDQPASWQVVKEISRSRCILGGFTSGTRNYFRVTAMNAAGESAPSDPVGKIAG